MMRIILFFLLIINISVYAQISLNTTGAAPDASAAWDIQFSDKGILIPRVNLTSTSSASPITSPATSLLVYNQATVNDVTPGYYYWNGSRWIRLLGSDKAWMLEGNAGTNPASNFLGTTDAVDLVLRTNNTERARITSAGNVGIGTASPSYKLHVLASANFPNAVIYGQNTVTSSDGRGVVGICNNTDFYGIGVEGIGGYMGVRASVSPTGSSTYYGTYSYVSGGSGSNYGVYSFSSGSGTNYGIYASVSGGSTNWAGYFVGNGYFSGNVGIGTTSPSTKLHVVGKTTLTRDNTTECCGNDATLALGENTQSTGRRASISFHNGNEAEGQIRLIQNTLNGVSSRRFQIFDNQSQGMGLELTGRLWYGNAGSRTEWRDNAGLQGNAGAQSGFYETNNPVNFPSGASSWWHLIDCRHSNTANNYALQIAGSFYDQRLWFRKTNGIDTQPWNEILTTANWGQGTTTFSYLTEEWLVGNNSGSYSTSPGIGYTPGTWQDVPNASVSRTITSGNRVVFNFSARWEIDSRNYYVPEMIWFRVVRDNSIVVGETAVFTGGDVSVSGWYFLDGNVSITIDDSGAGAGFHTWKIQYWLTNCFGSYTEYARIGERYLTVIEIKP